MTTADDETSKHAHRQVIINQYCCHWSERMPSSQQAGMHQLHNINGHRHITHTRTLLSSVSQCWASYRTFKSNLWYYRYSYFSKCKKLIFVTLKSTKRKNFPGDSEPLLWTYTCSYLKKSSNSWDIQSQNYRCLSLKLVNCYPPLTPPPPTPQKTKETLTNALKLVYRLVNHSIMQHYFVLGKSVIKIHAISVSGKCLTNMSLSNSPTDRHFLGCVKNVCVCS